MDENQNPDDDQFEDNFEDDFSFEEEEQTPPPAATPPSKGKPNTAILGIAGIIVVGIMGYMGWKFLSGPSKTTQTQQMAKGNEAAPTHEIVVPETSLPPKVFNPETAAAEHAKTQSTVNEEIKAAIKEEKNVVKGIEEAFSSADQNQAQPGTAQAPGVSLSEIKKELFAPEKNKTGEQAGANASAGANAATSGISKETTPGTPGITTPAPAEIKPSTSADSLQIAEAMKVLSRLNQQMDYSIDQIKQLDSYTRDIAQNIGKLNSDISALDNRVLALTNTTSSLSKDLGTVKSEVGKYKNSPPPVPKHLHQEAIMELEEEPVVKKRAIPGCPPPVEVPYTVHAVIPGRAWLKTPKGQIITVTEGEVIGNYGKVLVIDAANAVVLTNSGVTFR